MRIVLVVVLKEEPGARTISQVVAPLNGMKNSFGELAPLRNTSFSRRPVRQTRRS
jgi:hypothetical protein